MQNANAQILIITADDTRHGELMDALRQLSYVCYATPDGNQALKILASTPIDVIILGTTVKHLSYMDFLQTLYQQGVKIPVLMLVSLGELSAVYQQADTVITDYLYAPFLPEVLEKRIQSALAKGQLPVKGYAPQEQGQMMSSELTNVILSIDLEIAAETDMAKLLDRIVIEAQKLSNADAATLYLRTVDDRLQFMIIRTNSLNVALSTTESSEIPFDPLPLYDPETHKPNTHNVATSVALSGRTVNIPDVYTANEYDFFQTKEFDKRTGYRTVSTLTIPLKGRGNEVRGVLQLINALDPDTGATIAFTPNQQLMAELLASQSAIALNYQALLERQAHLLKLERDVQIGREIQASFLPDKLPESESWQLAVKFRPAREVAGDFYDAFLVGPQRLWVCLADVCDKGVGAALFMALTRSLLRAYAQKTQVLAPSLQSQTTKDGYSVAVNTGATTVRNTISLTNDYIQDNHAALTMFTTMFCGVLDADTGAFVYINAGHTASAIFDAQGNVRQRLEPTSPAVGIFPGTDFEIEFALLKPGDTLFCFTDGIPDAKDIHSGHFTEVPMIDDISTHIQLPVDKMLDHLYERIERFTGAASQWDDMTTVALRWLGRAGH